MLDRLNPEVAVISEFGSELKGFHFELVDKLREVLHKRQRDDSLEKRLTFVVPGDLTIAYDIANHYFLCHDTCKFTAPTDLCCRQAADWACKKNYLTDRYDTDTKGDASRVYLFEKNRSSGDSTTLDNRSAEEYYKKFFNHNLPYHKK